MRTCFVCGSGGEIVYEDLDDALFGVAGRWSFRRCSNPDCGLLWLDPQPLEEDIGRAYARYFTHDAATSRASAFKRAYGRVRASYLHSRLGYGKAMTGGGSNWLAPIANLHPGSGDVFGSWVMFLPASTTGGSLLDVGCGGGDFMLRMRSLGWKVTGVETDPIAVERARAGGLEVHQGDVRNAGLADSTFNAITMSHVIEHVHDPRSLLDKCRRLLQPGGILVMLTPNTASWGHRHFRRDWLFLDPPRHINVFNPSSMRRLLSSAGLAPLRIATLAINASAVWPASAAIRESRVAPNGNRRLVRNRSTGAGAIRQAAERLRLKVDPEAGEDLLAISTSTE